MNLYLISQTKTQGYDTFDSAVVAATCIPEAQAIHPNGNAAWRDDFTWCSTPEQVKAVLIGRAVEGTKPGLIIASFNAG
jgi:hypothetical protein